MFYSLKYRDKDNYLLATVSGEITTVEVAQECVHHILDTALKRDYIRILIQRQALTSNLDTYDAIKMVDTLSQTRPSARNVRIANVVTSGKAPSCTVYETILQNRSFNYRFFTTDDEALDWLLS